MDLHSPWLWASQTHKGCRVARSRQSRANRVQCSERELSHWVAHYPMCCLVGLPAGARSISSVPPTLLTGDNTQRKINEKKANAEQADEIDIEVATFHGLQDT